jgi:hypothetical protein
VLQVAGQARRAVRIQPARPALGGDVAKHAVALGGMC